MKKIFLQNISIVSSEYVSSEYSILIFFSVLPDNLNNAILSRTLVSSPSIATLVGSCVTEITPPTNGYISYSSGSSSSRPFPSGTVANMNCNHGFKPVGITSSTCLNGIWSPLVLGQCVAKGSKLFGTDICFCFLMFLRKKNNKTWDELMKYFYNQ